jgi:hypothetical protein
LVLSLATRTVGAVTFVELGFKTYTDTNTIGGKTGVSNTHTHTYTHTQIHIRLALSYYCIRPYATSV